MTGPTRLAHALPAPAIYVLSGVSQYVGSAVGVAVQLAAMPGYAGAWWRVCVGALAICAWRRPWRRPFTRADLAWSTVFGLFITVMNMTFYQALALIPMGTAVSIEFVGPVATAVVLSGGWRTRVGALATAAGVVSIGGFGLDLSNPSQAAGMVWALAAGAAWAGYIVVGTTIAHRRNGIDSLAIGLLSGALLTAPLVGPHLADALTPRLLLAALAVGLLATALPFPLEQLAMRRLGPDLVSLMSAVLPATSVVVAAVTLRQVPTPGEACGVALITAGIVLVQWRPGARAALRQH